MTTDLHRPRPVDHPAAPVTRDTLPHLLAQRLLEGETLQVTDRYATGRAILRALGRKLPAPKASAPYAERQAHRKTKLHAARRLLVGIQAHAVAVADAPPCGFLAELYPELPDFALSFVDVEDLSRAWRFYDEGVPFAALGHTIHPFYGTYAPTRTEHVELFATWLSTWDGPKGRAVDVGTGSGILALLLARAGFGSILATDLNPNAVESVHREVARRPAPIEARVADLLERIDGPFDLVVFNPPWMQGTPKRPLDRALFYEPGLLERFFDQALERLGPAGRVVLVFSNILTLVQKDLPHPIETELARGRFTLEEKLRRKVVPKPGPDGKRRRTKEKVEVWVLKPAIEPDN